MKQIQYVLKQDPNNPVMHRLEGYNNYKLGNYALAAEQLQAFLKDNPEKDHIYLDYLMLGQSLIKDKKAIEAVTVLQKATQAKDAKPESLKELAAAYDAADNFPEEVATYEEYFTKEASPSVYDYFYYGQACYRAASNYITPEALNAKLTPAQQATNDTVFQSFIEKGNAAFDEVISRSPESYLGYLWKANLNSFIDAVDQSKTGKMPGVAKPYYEDALKIMLEKNENGARNKDIISAYDYLGKLAYTQGNTALMGDYYKKIIAIDPANEAAKQVLDALKIKY
ncbi:MAG: hypothetical protein LBN18_00705 [Dysgonamonadaceae bacterium]|nr:hypothetical protein [Dysgonamonadaceae bacterium]